MGKYELCESCGGEVIDGKPHYIPLGEDALLEIIDQTCTKCGAAIIGEYQKTRKIISKEAHDRLIGLLGKHIR